MKKLIIPISFLIVGLFALPADSSHYSEANFQIMPLAQDQPEDFIGAIPDCSRNHIFIAGGRRGDHGNGNAFGGEDEGGLGPNPSGDQDGTGPDPANAMDGEHDGLGPENDVSIGGGDGECDGDGSGPDAP